MTRHQAGSRLILNRAQTSSHNKGMKVDKTDGAANTLKQMRSCSLPDRAAAGRLILGSVVWVARRGLGSGVGVKELPSECYRPQTAPPPSPVRWDVADMKTENTVGPINRWCRNRFSCSRGNKADADARRPANSSDFRAHRSSHIIGPLARLEGTISV